MGSLFRIAVAATGLWYGWASAVSGVEFARAIELLRAGNETRAFIKLVRAEAAFPYAYYHREAVAVIFGVANTMPPEVNLEWIDRMLADDPYGGNLLWNKVVQELRRGNVAMAGAALAVMRRVSGGWPQTENAQLVFDAVVKEIEKQKAQDAATK